MAKHSKLIKKKGDFFGQGLNTLPFANLVQNRSGKFLGRGSRMAPSEAKTGTCSNSTGIYYTCSYG